MPSPIQFATPGIQKALSIEIEYIQEDIIGDCSDRAYFITMTVSDLNSALAYIPWWDKSFPGSLKSQRGMILREVSPKESDIVCGLGGALGTDVSYSIWEVGTRDSGLGTRDHNCTVTTLTPVAVNSAKTS